jgi:hypothetical protein
MPKPRGGARAVFRAPQRDTRYAKLIEKSMPPAHQFGTEHVTPPLDDVKALDVQRGIYRSARHAGISARVETTCAGCKALLQQSHKRGCEEPGYIVRFWLTTKAQGRKAITERVKAGKPLAYNLRRGKT